MQLSKPADEGPHNSARGQIHCDCMHSRKIEPTAYTVFRHQAYFHSCEQWTCDCNDLRTDFDLHWCMKGLCTGRIGLVLIQYSATIKLPIWCETLVWRCRNAGQSAAAHVAVCLWCIFRLQCTGCGWNSLAALNQFWMVPPSNACYAALSLSTISPSLSLSVVHIYPLNNL